MRRRPTTVYDQLGGKSGRSGRIGSAARVIAKVAGRQSLDDQHGGPRSGGDDGHVGQSVDRFQSVEPLDPYGSVAFGQHARHLTRFTLADVTESERDDLWNDFSRTDSMTDF